MPSVKLKENEPFDIALRRFKRTCEKAGVLSEVRRREFYRLLYVSVKQQQLLSVTRRKFSAKQNASKDCTRPL